MRKAAVKDILEKELQVPPERLEGLLAKMENSTTGKRNGKQPPPEGGISLREAERKYGILQSTISRWVKRGGIPILLRSKNWLYVDEQVLAEIIEKYKQRSGQGKRTIQLPPRPRPTSMPKNRV